jgi:hypothetical protein
LTSRPEWTLDGALLRTEQGVARLEQGPFLWINGAWEADVSIAPVEPAPDMQTIMLKVRVTPDTLRRWQSVGINPFIEACAQVEEYWRDAATDRIETLTWL